MLQELDQDQDQDQDRDRSETSLVIRPRSQTVVNTVNFVGFSVIRVSQGSVDMMEYLHSTV